MEIFEQKMDAGDGDGADVSDNTDVGGDSDDGGRPVEEEKDLISGFVSCGEKPSLCC